MSPWLCLCLLVCLTTSSVHASSSLMVDAPAGKFEGIEETANSKQTYVAFRGIPYAKPPVGELRFAKPQPHPKFDKPFAATGDIVECPQPQLPFMPAFDPGQEDCLILNVYTKKLSSTSQDAMKKVIVFIHGGGFILGSSQNAVFGTFVTEHEDIIMVTINYRLGVIGFLSTENEASPGNYGLWDQALALKWVKDNIASFGGDADDITISGESAGGASVAFQTITPVTKGLFTKAFPMSGTATSAFANPSKPQVAALQFAKSVNCWGGETDTQIGLDQSKEIITCLREVPVSNFTSYPIFNIDNVQFVPTVDGEFLSQTPARLLHDNQYLESVGFFQRSYMLGIDNNEQALMGAIKAMSEGSVANMDDKTEEEKAAIVAGINFKIQKNVIMSRLGLESISDELVTKIMDWYEKRAVDTSLEELVTDLNFLLPTFDFLETLAKRNSDSVYLFYFNYYPSFMKGAHRGMPHGGDLCFWLDVRPEDLEKILRAGLVGDLDQDEQQMKAIFSSVIADFARTGNPGKSLKLPSRWPAYDLKEFHYLDLNLDPCVKGYLEREKRKLWFETIPGWLAESGHSNAHTEL